MRASGTAGGRGRSSYWLVQASRVPLGGRTWTGQGWAVVIGWAAILAVLARLAYKRDTARV